MSSRVRVYLAWIVSGAILDALVMMLLILGAWATSADLFYPQLRFELFGSALSLVHLILLPGIVWKDCRLKACDYGLALVQTALVPLAALLSASAGLIAGAVLYIIQGFSIGLICLALPRSLGNKLEFICVYIATAVGLFVGGAACTVIVSGLPRSFRPVRGFLHVRTAALGGGFAAMLLAYIPMLLGGRSAPLVLGSKLPLIAGLAVLAGLPHLILACRDIGRDELILATFSVAVRRLTVLSAALAGGLWLLVAL